MGVAAAALVMSTAGITYVLTARSLAPDQNGPVAGIIPSGGETQAQGNSGSIQDPSGSSVAAPPVQVDGRNSVNVAQRGGSSAQRAGTPASLASRDQAPSASDVVYGKEIELLQKIVNQRRTQLDSSTVAIIERNLQIIDNAIQQSRAALAKDPASLLLSEQLTHALDKKVELLRTAAMLPAST
jgi:hypothetical protein